MKAFSSGAFQVFYIPENWIKQGYIICIARLEVKKTKQNKTKNKQTTNKKQKNTLIWQSKLYTPVLSNFPVYKKLEKRRTKRPSCVLLFYLSSPTVTVNGVFANYFVYIYIYIYILCGYIYIYIYMRVCVCVCVSVYVIHKQTVSLYHNS